MAGTASTSRADEWRQEMSHGGSESGSSSEGGSHSHTLSTTIGHSETDSESHSTGGSKSSSASKSYASGEVDEQIKQRKAELEKNGYQQSDDVAAAKQRLYESINSKPAFESQFQNQLQTMYDNIVGMDKFSYDWNNDPMYKMYRDSYQQAGKDAMRDTVGQASQLSGGYANSYATSAGQQAYQQLLEQLNTKVIPQLRDQALQEYEAERANQLQNFQLANSMYQNEYNQYRDAMSDYQWQSSFDQQLMNSERNFDYNQFSDDRAYMQSEFWNQRNAEQSNVAAAETNDWNDTYAHSETDYWEQTETTSDVSNWNHTSSWANTWNNSQAHTLSDSSSLSMSLAGGGGAAGRASANARTAEDLLKNSQDRYSQYNMMGVNARNMSPELRTNVDLRDSIVEAVEKTMNKLEERTKDRDIEKAMSDWAAKNKVNLTDEDKIYVMRRAGWMF